LYGNPFARSFLKNSIQNTSCLSTNVFGEVSHVGLGSDHWHILIFKKFALLNQLDTLKQIIARQRVRWTSGVSCLVIEIFIKDI
jgi:hypothetical protein